MNKLYHLSLCLIFSLAVFVSGCGTNTQQTEDTDKNVSKKYTVVDDRGTETVFKKKPQRIVTFTAAMDEIVLGLIAPDRMVAVNEAFNDPKTSNIAELAKKIPNKIQRNPGVETVAALKPDCVFVQTWISLDSIEALRSLGIPVIVCKTARNIEDIRANISLIASALGEKERGDMLIQKLNTELENITAKIDKLPADKKGKSIAMISIMPGYGGAGSMFDELCKYTSTLNAKAEAGIKHGQSMTKEQLVAANPDYLFLPTYKDVTSNEEKYGKEYMNDPSLQTMTAVKEGHVVHPWARYIYNTSQNVVFGVQETARMIYGEDFAQPLNRHLSVAENK